MKTKLPLFLILDEYGTVYLDNEFHSFEEVEAHLIKEYGSVAEADSLGLRTLELSESPFTGETTARSCFVTGWQKGSHL